MKKISKIMQVVLIIAIIALTGVFQSNVYAAEKKAEDISINDIMDAGSDWINKGKTAGENSKTTPEAFVEQLIGIGQILVAVGIVTILVVTVIMAIRWITATPDKQAKLKEQLIGLVIATVVIFGAVGIWNLVRGIMSNIETNPDMLGYNNQVQTIVIVNK